MYLNIFVSKTISIKLTFDNSGPDHLFSRHFCSEAFGSRNWSQFWLWLSGLGVIDGGRLSSALEHLEPSSPPGETAGQGRWKLCQMCYNYCFCRRSLFHLFHHFQHFKKIWQKLGAFFRVFGSIKNLYEFTGNTKNELCYQYLHLEGKPDK